jgi:hypothetical protein
MAKKQAKAPKEKKTKEKLSVGQSLSLFDHVNNLHTKKIKWADLTEASRKTFQPYMVTRILSMNPIYTEFVNEMQVYTNSGTIPNDVLYAFFQAILPSYTSYVPYIKSKKESIPPILLEYMYRWFQVSERELVEYMEFLTNDDILHILESFGLSEKEIKNAIKG